jgi:cytochrome P450
LNSKTPPGPPIKFFGLNQVPKFRGEQLMKTFEEYAATYGDVVRVSLGGLEQTMVFHPDYVRQILFDDSDKITKSRLQQRLLGVFHGKSLTNSDGDLWKRQRKLMQPAFHTRRIQTYVDIMVKHTATTFQHWKVGETFDIAEAMVNLTIAVVGESLLGTDVSGLADRIEDALHSMQYYVMRKAPSIVPLPLWFPIPYHRRAQAAIKELRSLVTGLIQARRTSREDLGDLLSMILLATDEEAGGHMSDLQARDEVISMLIVGHVTTAGALGWIFAELTRHPEAQAKMVAELDAVLGGRAPSMGDIRQLKYVDMVIKETLRLHPPSWAMPRDVIQDIQLGEYTIPKGTGVLFSEHVMHRDARWFPEPERFLPERFAEGWEDKIPKCAYMPFGMGSHNCIGQIFSATEMHVILAMIFQRYKLIPEPGQEIVASTLMSQRLRYGLKVKLELRQ